MFNLKTWIGTVVGKAALKKIEKRAPIIKTMTTDPSKLKAEVYFDNNGSAIIIKIKNNNPRI